MNRRDLETEQRLKRRLDEIGRAWREGADGPEPPDLVDRAVLNRARRAVEPPAWRQPRLWLRGFAAAAVAVVAVTVVLQQRPPSPVQPQALPSTAPRPAAEAAEAEPAARFEAHDAGTIQPAAKVGAVRSRAVPEGAAEQADSPSGAFDESAAEVAGSVASDLDEDRAAGVAEPETVAPPPGTPASSAGEPREADTGTRTSRTRLEEEAEALSAAAAAELEATRQDAEAPGAATQAARPSAEEWLARLEELRAAGDEAAFEDELARFREAYPEHPLPEHWDR